MIPLVSEIILNDMFSKVWVSWQTGVLTIDLLDFLFVVTAVIFNLQVIGVYIASRNGRLDTARRYGTMTLLLAFPFALVFAGYSLLGQEKWIMVGLVLIFLYLFVELMLDFVLKIEFRTIPLLHGPYIVLFYLVQAALIGIAFSIDNFWGWLVSITFWALLGALIYSLWPKKKHMMMGSEYLE